MLKLLSTALNFEYKSARFNPKPGYIFPHPVQIRRFFKNRERKGRKAIKSLREQFKFGKNKALRMFTWRPQVFVEGSHLRSRFQSKMQLINSIMQNEPLYGQIIKHMMGSNHAILYKMSNENVTKVLELIKSYDMTPNQAKKIFLTARHIFNNKFENIFEEKLSIFRNYLQIQNKQVFEILECSPFLLAGSTTRIQESIHYFLQSKSKVMTKEKIIYLLKEIGEIFLLGRSSLSEIRKWYLSWGIQNDKLWQILIENPMLFMNLPKSIMPTKMKLFKYFRFTLEMGRDMLTKFPSILICSIGSLEAKMIFIRDRLKLPINQKTMELLSFRFALNLRSRGEIIVRKKIAYTEDDIVDYFRVSEEQFLKRVQVTVQRFNEEKTRYPETPELDFLKKKSLQYYRSNHKLIALSKKYFEKAL